MKKVLIFSAVLGVFLITLGAAGLVFAQSNPPYQGYGPGMMGGGGIMGGWYDGSYGPMHDAMLEAFSAKLGLTVDELQSRLSAGESMAQIAAAQGFSLEEFRALMIEARTEAIDQAVRDGLLTQEQADWMLQHMGGVYAGGFGPGACHGFAGGLQGTFQRGPGWRWNNSGNQ